MNEGTEEIKQCLRNKVIMEGVKRASVRIDTWRLGEWYRHLLEHDSLV